MTSVRCEHGRIPERCAPCVRPASRTEGFPARVWITQAGKKFHSGPRCEGVLELQAIAHTQGKNTYAPREVTISEAIFSNERAPCPRCFPEKAV
ncbi:hypothetical protein ACFVH6_02315 [Spirillospora sp. NPDC127200]